jgi:hypothetical protein
MNLPDAPIAHEGFFAGRTSFTHFFYVKRPGKSKDFHVRILSGSPTSGSATNNRATKECSFLPSP